MPGMLPAFLGSGVAGAGGGRAGTALAGGREDPPDIFPTSAVPCELPTLFFPSLAPFQGPLQPSAWAELLSLLATPRRSQRWKQNPRPKLYIAPSLCNLLLRDGDLSHSHRKTQIFIFLAILLPEWEGWGSAGIQPHCPTETSDPQWSPKASCPGKG